MGRKPHIIIFNPDEMRWDTMGHMGNPAAATPFLDAFARTEAVSFRNAYCQNPVCVPSRCSFFTGLYPHTRGHRTMSYLLRPGEETLFSELKSAGYYVWMNDRNDLLAGRPEYRDLLADMRYRLMRWLQETADIVPFDGDMRFTREMLLAKGRAAAGKGHDEEILARIDAGAGIGEVIQFALSLRKKG